MGKKIKGVISMILPISMVFGSVVGGGTGATAAERVAAKQPELKMWYAAAATDWETEALPLGNGFIGSMVFGGVERDRIQVNEHTLWSGGPGADENYNGGIKGTAEDIQAALQNVRSSLQDKMSDFTENSSAIIGDDGKVVAKDYAPEDAALRAEISKLMGDKNNFGSYQTLGNILISDTDAFDEVPRVTEIVSNCDALNPGEGVAMMFDGSDSTKWYAAAGGEGDKKPGMMYMIQWSYETAYEAASYSIISGNDAPERDPKNFELYGSNDGVNFEFIDAQENVMFNERKELKTFVFGEKVTYSTYRLVIMETRDKNSFCQITEIAVNKEAEVESIAKDMGNYRRELDLDNSLMTVSYSLNGTNFTRKYFISYPDNIMVIELTADQPGQITKIIEITSEQAKKTISAENGVITMVGQPADQKENGLRFAQQLKVMPQGGEMRAEDGRIYIDNADSVLMIMAAGTNYQQCMDDSYDYFTEEDPLDAVSERVEKAAAKTFDQLYKVHNEDYKKLFDRVKINFEGADSEGKATDALLTGYDNRTGAPNTAAQDRFLEIIYYQYGRYLLISSSREGTLPANLQGIWAEGLNPPWAADYHTNINLQMNYWLAQQTNLAECHTPVIEYVRSLVPRGETVAQTYYTTQDNQDVRGWVIHHENNIWGNAAPGNYYEGFYFPAAAAWMCQDIWEYYAFTKDEQFLRDNYDVLMSAALFWVDNLWLDSRDNTLVANPSYSPEHGVYSLGASCDQEIIWELFNEVVTASEILGISSSELEEVKAAMSNLHMPKIGLAGQYMEWKDEIIRDITGDNQHRHVNHLYALHPGTYIVAGRSDADDEAVEAMKVTLNTRGDGGTGWSKAWKINFWARLRDGNHSHDMVRSILTGSTTANLYDTHPPFQIDGNFGATAGMTEMLLQSQGDSIDLLPSLPDAWATGSYEGLMARGNFEIAMDWKDKEVTQVIVQSNAGEQCVINSSNFSKAFVKLNGTDNVDYTAIDGDTISFPTQAGQVYTISFVDEAVTLSGEASVNEAVEETVEDTTEETVEETIDNNAEQSQGQAGEQPEETAAAEAEKNSDTSTPVPAASDSDESKSGPNAGLIVGIVAGVAALMSAAGFLVYRFVKGKNANK